MEQNKQTSRKPKVVLVGLGWVGSELARRLVQNWEIIGIDTNPVHKDRDDLPKAIRFVNGDACNPVVLKRAGADKAEVLVATTHDDEINLQAVKAALEVGISRCVVLIRKPENQQRAEKLGAETVLGSVHIASAIESRLQEGIRFTGDIGLGMGEIIEATVLPGSTSAGLSLKELSPQRWLIAAVYRDNKLVIPHGDTVLQEGDRVLLVGEPEVLPGAAELIRTGLPKFPLRFGSRVLVTLCREVPERYLEEALYLASSSNAEDADFFHAKNISDKRKRVIQSLMNRLNEGDYGVLVFPPVKFGFSHKWGKRHLYQELFSASPCPILISRASFAYTRFLVPVFDAEKDKLLVELSVDAARTFGAEINFVTVKPPALVSGPGQRARAEQALASAQEMAKLYRVSAQCHMLSGNPIKAVLNIASSYDLVILRYPRNQRNNIFSPSVSLHIAAKSPVSVLVVPD